MTSLARQAAHALRKHSLRVQPANLTPFATHLPILVALAKMCNVRRVLELGSGTFSTPLYLNRGVFPDLEMLVSYEDDPEWLDVVMDAVGKDVRLDLRMVEAVRNAIPDDLSRFDLIFVDDSRTTAERSTTIANIAQACPSGLVVIHDFEQRRYRIAARGFTHRFVFSTFTPQVGVCWNDLSLSLKKLREARTLIAGNAKTAVTDVERWSSVLSQLGRE